MDWSKLYFGKLNKKETLDAIKDEEWQRIRISMKNKSLEHKYTTLSNYVKNKQGDYALGIIDKDEYKKVLIRSTNYVTALSRGGLIKPEDYRK